MPTQKIEIVETKDVPNPVKDYLMYMIGRRDLTPEILEAITNLTSASTPAYAVQTHPGKGGKIMSYLSHVWVSAQLNNAFGQMWGMDVKNVLVHDDSVSAVVSLYIDFPSPKLDGSTYRRTITEIGSFDGGGGKMSKSNMVASAVSRGLVKCCFRAFRLGEDLYADAPEPTVKSAWASIKKMGMKRGLTEEKIISIIKEMKVDQKDLLNKFVEVWQAIYAATVEEGELPEL